MILDDRRQPPMHSYMLDERLGPVLDEKIDGVNMGIDKIAEDKIDDSVSSAERNSRFRAKSSQWKKSFTLSPGQNKRKNLWICHYASGKLVYLIV
jgi:hypothetical protein